MALCMRVFSFNAAPRQAVRFFIRKRSRLTSSYIHGSADEPLLGTTIGKQLEIAVNKNPGKPAVIFTNLNKQYSFEQLLTAVDQLAAAFLAQGVRTGDRIGVWGPNKPEWLIAQFATARIGAVMVNVNPLYRPNELEYALNKVGVSYLLIDEPLKSQNFYELLCESCPELRSGKVAGMQQTNGFFKRIPSLKRVWTMVDNAQPGTIGYSELIASANNEHFKKVQHLQDVLQFDDPINIQFTSGTTGHPKGATLTHHGILNNAYLSGARMGYNTFDARICAPVPFYHCFGCVLANLQIPAHGSTVVVPDLTFSAEKTLRAVHQARATNLYGTPTMFIDMLNHPAFSTYDLSSLRGGVAAGAPCPPPMLREMIDRMHLKEIRVGYGSTEISPLCTLGLAQDTFDDRVSTVGFVCEHVEIKLVDSDNRLVKIGEPGEVLTRGYSTMLGYWNDPEKTRDVISDSRWYRTGDIGVMDDRGYLRISGRIKDMIIRGGENVYPAEIEKFLLTYKDSQDQLALADVHVVGVPDERLGEAVCACIKLRAGKQATAEQLIAFCEGKLARFKIPRYYLFVNDYPMTVTGKVQKFQLRKIAAEKLGLHKINHHLKY